MLSKILLVVYTAFQTTYLQEKSWITLNISFKNLKNVLTLNNLNKCDFVSFLIDIVSVDSRTISLSHPSPCDKMTGISRDKRQAAAHSKVSFHPSDRAPKLRIVAITHKQQHGKEASAAEVIWIQEEREDTFNQKFLELQMHFNNDQVMLQQAQRTNNCKKKLLNLGLKSQH
nr:uncharacterized protein LOC123567477 isoform X2 [Macaca fascicularis]